MTNRDAIIGCIYTIGYKYLFSNFNGISVENYHKWFENFKFPYSIDDLKCLYDVWYEIVDDYFICDHKDMPVYNLFIKGLEFVKQNKFIKRKDYTSWFFKIINLEYKYNSISENIFLENLSYHFKGNQSIKLKDMLYEAGRNVTIYHFNISIKEYNKWFKITYRRC